MCYLHLRNRNLEMYRILEMYYICCFISESFTMFPNKIDHNDNVYSGLLKT